MDKSIIVPGDDISSRFIASGQSERRIDQIDPGLTYGTAGILCNGIHRGMRKKCVHVDQLTKIHVS